MKNKNEKGAIVGLVVCFVAMIAIVGMITFSQYERGIEEQKRQLSKTKTEEKKDNTDNADVKEPTQSTNTDSVQAEIKKPVIVETPIVDVTPEPAPPTLHFSAANELLWPVDGNVILSYSMDQTVYFSTLDQYKYNPAIIIGGEVGMEVLASADGEITSIEVDAQTGTTITMKLGDSYELVYGQVKEVTVHQGDRVDKGDVLGYLSEPTKYYSVEGPNLYFQVLKDGEPVNPLEYLEG